MPPRSLADLLDSAAVTATVRGDASVGVSSVALDSRDVQPGALFCCLRGEHADGHRFAPSAVAAGAVALLVDHHVDLPSDGSGPDVPQVVVADTRIAMGLVASALHGHPCRALTMVGVTGTNGKTTTTSLIASILESAGTRTGVIGTLTGAHTTPEAPDLQQQLAAFVAEGKGAVVMEVSSHALALHRVAGCHFDLAVFTNLGRDHLDLHGTIERYFAAKASLFTPALSDRGISNSDDIHGRWLIDGASIPMVGFSIDDVSDLVVTATGHSYSWRGVHVEVGIGGAFNVMNSLAAATAAAELGLPPHAIAAGLAAAPPVPGRFEPVGSAPFDVIVDYAHTPDGLREALRAARDAGAGNLLVVFGCGGDRDREKRPQMGAVAAALADQVVLTSDNPRSEDPRAIIDAIIEGIPEDYRDLVVIEPDRRLAFAAAFRLARPGDIVVIAGKGHETTQTTGTTVVPFDDRAVARQLLETMP